MVNSLKRFFIGIDNKLVVMMKKRGVDLLRYSIGIIFIWFGFLKPLGLSPAHDLILNTVYWFDNREAFIPILGYWEMAIGISMIIRPLIRLSIFLLFIQMPGTFLPLILLPSVCFVDFPFSLTLEGQYIIKNLIIISSSIVVGGSVR